MREVRGEEFLHYQSKPKAYWQGVGVTPWEVGATYVVGPTFNPYFDFFNRYWGTRAGLAEALRLVEELTNVGQSNTEATVGVEQTVSWLRTIVDDLWKQSDLVRELVFEDVRRQHFPEHPSRQRCIWVVPPTAESITYWQNRSQGQKRWFRVRLTGKIHAASDAWLKGDTISLNQLREIAWKYWSGLPGDKVDQDELLFEGIVEVIAEIGADEEQAIGAS